MLMFIEFYLLTIDFFSSGLWISVISNCTLLVANYNSISFLLTLEHLAI